MQSKIDEEQLEKKQGVQQLELLQDKIKLLKEA